MIVDLKICVKKNQNYLYLGMITLVLALVSSCYPSSFTETKPVNNRSLLRQQAVTAAVRADMVPGQRYINYGFGNEMVVRPVSFKRLDSLYSAFHEEENKAGSSKNRLMRLREEIDREKDKVLQDTVLFQYEVPHFFGIAQGDSLEITYAIFVLNHKKEVTKVSIDYYFIVHNRLSNFYSTYVRRESFSEFGFLPDREELEFYDLYDAVATSLSSPERKGNFIAHTLQIMHAIHIQRGSFETEPIIKQHVINILTAHTKDYAPLRWSKIYANFDENDQLSSYEVDHQWSFKDSFGVIHSLTRRFTLTPYFEITLIETIESVRA